MPMRDFEMLIMLVKLFTPNAPHAQMSLDGIEVDLIYDVGNDPI